MPDGLNSEDIKTLIEAGDWVFTAREKPLQIAKPIVASLCQTSLII